MTPEPVQEWLTALQRQGREIKEKGRDKWQAQCPAHDDHNPSLSVAIGDNGKVLITCFAGCTFDEVRKALGIGGQPSQNGQNGHRTPIPARKPPKPTQLPAGPQITRYDYQDAEGDTVFAVTRHDPPDGKKYFRQWTPDGELWIAQGPPSGRPMYKLPDVLAKKGRVIIVEGEKCQIATQEAWPKQIITCWAGGTNAWHLTDWTPLKGREATLVADSDTPGHKAMQALAAHLYGLGCSVRIVLPPLDWNTDIADWIAEGGKDNAAGIITRLVEDFTPALPEPEPSNLPAVVEHAEPPDVLAVPYEAEMYSNKHYQILGLTGDKVAVLHHSTGIVHHSRKEITKVDTLQSIATLRFWSKYTDHEEITPKQARLLGDALMQEADKLGQLDVARIVGRGAVRMANGQVVYHLGDRLLADGECIPLEHADYVWLPEPSIALTDPSTQDDMSRVADAVMRYRWMTDDDGRRFLAWVVSAIIGGALKWRPHLWLNAPAASGKTWLIEDVLTPLLGPLFHHMTDVTAAGLSRMTGRASLPIAIDEAEPTIARMQPVQEILRAASGGEGMRVRADSGSGGVMIQQPRFSALVASTSIAAMTAADASRMTVVRLGDPVEDWPSVQAGIMRAMQHAPGVRARIIRGAEDIVNTCIMTIAEMQGLGMDSREAMASGALTACWRVWGLDDSEIHANTDEQEMPDPIRCLHDMMAATVRWNNEDKPILTLIRGGGLKDLLPSEVGIRPARDGLLIATMHSGLIKRMERTKWGNVDLRRMLLQLPGARYTPNPRSFSGTRHRAVYLPGETLIEAGIDITETSDEGESNG